MSSPNYVRVGQCSRRYDCAVLNCCGDCEELLSIDGIGYCKVELNKPETCKESPTFVHWLQQTYWSRGIDCSYRFEEVVL